MENKKIFLFILALLLIVGASYLLYVNMSGQDKLLSMDDIKNMENKKEGDCWKLEDNRTVCYFGTTNVAPNELSEVNGLSATDKEPENKILAEDGSYVNADFYKDDVSVVPGETIFLN